MKTCPKCQKEMVVMSYAGQEDNSYYWCEKGCGTTIEMSDDEKQIALEYWTAKHDRSEIHALQLQHLEQAYQLDLHALKLEMKERLMAAGVKPIP